MKPLTINVRSVVVECEKCFIPMVISQNLLASGQYIFCPLGHDALGMKAKPELVPEPSKKNRKKIEPHVNKPRQKSNRPYTGRKHTNGLVKTHLTDDKLAERIQELNLHFNSSAASINAGVCPECGTMKSELLDHYVRHHADATYSTLMKLLRLKVYELPQDKMSVLIGTNTTSYVYFEQGKSNLNTANRIKLMEFYVRHHMDPVNHQYIK